MTYRAVINLDFTNQNANAYQKLVAALIQAGWTYRETSALSIETTEVERIWIATEVIAKQAGSAGTLSALTIQVQLLGPQKKYKAAANHPKALTQVLKKAHPSMPK